jgi:hypothetical protein
VPTFAESFADAKKDIPSLPSDAVKAAYDEYERIERANWAKRFEGARANIPEKFNWIGPRKPAEFALPATLDMHVSWNTYVPWFTAAHARRLFAHWQSKTNLLIVGPVGAGKTCLAILHAQWTLALAGYDATEIRAARLAKEAWDKLPTRRRLDLCDLDEPCEVADGMVTCTRVAHLDKHAYARADNGYSPPEPEWLPQVKDAQHLKFVSVPGMLDNRLQGPDETLLRDAKKASVLYFDDVGKEMARATGGGHVAASRRAIVVGVLQARWENNRRFVATSEHGLDELCDMYGPGAFRRIAGELSGATVIFLGSDEWGGKWVRELAAKAQR